MTAPTAVVIEKNRRQRASRKRQSRRLAAQRKREKR